MMNMILLSLPFFFFLLYNQMGKDILVNAMTVLCEFDNKTTHDCITV